MVTMDLRVAWETIEKSLSNRIQQDAPGEETMLEAAHVLEQRQLGHIISEWFFENFKRDLQQQVSPLFWERFQEAVPSSQVVSHVAEAVRALYEHVAAYSASFEKLAAIQILMAPEADHKENVARSRDHAQMLLKAIIFSKTTRHFQDAFHEFYNRAFKCFDTTDLEDLDESSEEEEEPLRCAGCEEDRDRCHCDTIRNSFHAVNKQLSELGLLERLSGSPVSALIHHRIRHHVDHHCKGNFETSYLSQMEQWLDTKVVGWLELIYGRGVPNLTPVDKSIRSPSPILPHPEDMTLDNSLDASLTPRDPTTPSPISIHPMTPRQALGTPAHAMTPSASTTATVKATTIDDSPVAAHKGRLHHYLYTVYADIRIDQLFNIIVEFPDSEPALVDLGVCLEKTDRRSKLVVMLKNALETRLLHPGVNTGDILTAYVSAIRALRVLDHTGVLLELVCEPVRKYLRSREDTVRRIVSDLTGDSGNELSEELIKGQPLVLDNSYHSDEDASNWESWQPDPIDADPSRVSASRRSSDIISMLVNIYGSKELFVNEYRTLLADRLLTHFHSATEREIRNLELLKLRFGEQQLHYCEVMLKDVADSKRINAHITDHLLKEERKREASSVPATTTITIMPDSLPTTAAASTSRATPVTTSVTTSMTSAVTTTMTPAVTTEMATSRQENPGPSISRDPGSTVLGSLPSLPPPPAPPPPHPSPPPEASASLDKPAPGTSSSGAPGPEQAQQAEVDAAESKAEVSPEQVDMAEDPKAGVKPETKETDPTTAKKEDDISVTAMILSAQFWPTFREEKLQLPDVMQRALDKYTKGYETLKGNRSLCWKNHLGLVNVEIELKDGRNLDINVSPAHATIIWHFQKKSRWTVDELSSVMQMPASGLRRKMALWQSHGLLREETTDTFVLSEDARGRGSGDVIMDEDETESAMASASDQREEELQVLWSYIVGMLTNLESLPLERIHSMLKMFMMQSPTSTEVPLPELKAYLDRQVKDQKLVHSAGVYRLPKSGS